MIVPFVVIHFLKMITGDALSAVVLGLTIFVTVAAWLAGPSASTRRRNRSDAVTAPTHRHSFGSARLLPAVTSPAAAGPERASRSFEGKSCW